MLVLLPPIGLDRGAWARTGLDGVCFEYPGHGARLEEGTSGLTFEEIADEVAATTDGPMDLVGVSMGARVAQYVAVRHPDRVRSAVFCASSPGGTRESAAAVTRDERAEETRELGMVGTLTKTLRRWFTPAALAAPDHPGVAYVARRWLANDPAVVSAAWLLLRRNTIGEHLRDISAPVTVLGGGEDTAASPDRVLGLYRQLAGQVRLEIIPGPHLLPAEEPAAFGAAVRRHLAWAAQEGIAA